MCSHILISSYKQQKYNLCREECEGYAKLVTELNGGGDSASSAASVISVVQSIIGFFNLDPNRVLDVMLESFECNLDRHEFYAELLRLYRPDANTLAELLGFKLKFYESEVSARGLHELLHFLTMTLKLVLNSFWE